MTHAIPAARRVAAIAAISMLLGACSLSRISPAEEAAPASAASSIEPPAEETGPRSGEPADPEQDWPEATAAVIPAQQPTQPQATASAAALGLGPDSYPEGVNPLTGEFVSDPALLQYCPLLVAISNFPPSSRQAQSGLSLAAQVWETYIGEGMTRYLAVFYGDYLAAVQGILENPLADPFGFVIGPVRSGRVAFEDIKVLFPGATLITAGASVEVAQQLTGVQTAYGSNPEDINSAGLGPSELTGLECRHGKPPSLVGLSFDSVPPPGGTPAEFFRVIYNYYNQIGWEYSPAQSAYLRSQDKADGSGELYPTLESLTGEQLAYDNVLVMYADHHYLKPTIIEISLMYVDDHQGLLFRDGNLYPVKWSTLRGELRISDLDGNSLPLKPGSTFLEVVSYQTTWDPEQMIVRYHNP